MNEENYEKSATPTNADSSSLQPLGMYAEAASVRGPDALDTGKPTLAKLSAEDYASIVDAPLTGEEVALKIAQLNEAGIDITPSTINIEEFKAYDEWRKKQHFDFWGAIGDGVVQTGKDLGKGVASAATDWKKASLAAGLSAAFTPAVGLSVAYGSTALEAFYRGTRDLGGLFVMAANHPSSPLYRMFINPTGDINQSYQDFMDLSSWNAQSEKIISGKTNALMPDRDTYEKLFGKSFGGGVDDFIGVNKELATAASYILDPTVFFTFGASSGAKAGVKAVANKAGAAAIKSGQAGAAAGAVAARASRNAMKTTFLNSLGEGMVKFSDALATPIESGYQWISKNIEDITGGGKLRPTGHVGYRKVTPNKGHGPSSFAHATLGSLGVYGLFSIPYAIPAASIYAGIKAIGYAGEAIAKTGTKAALGTGASAVAKGIQMSTPLAMYFSDLAKTTAHGSLYGGLIGFAASGEEGAAGGIGTGATLGAIGHNVALGAGTITGQFARMAQRKQFDDRIKYLEEKGHLLKAKNLRKFVDDIKSQLGDDAGDRLTGEILALEQGKNTDVMYFSPEDMQKAWESDPDYWTEVDDGKGGKTKVLTDLGAEIRRNALAGGESWNGLFMEVDPKTGKSLQTPILHYKDAKSGRWKVVINTEAMKYVRNPDGTLKTVTQTVTGKRMVTKEKTTMVEGAREYTETIEGPRPRGLPSDPTVPRDEAGKPPAPEAAATEDVNVGDDFTAPARVTGTKGQARRRAGTVIRAQIGEVETTIPSGDMILKPDGSLQEKVDPVVRRTLEKLTPSERLEVVKEHNEKIAQIKEARKTSTDNANKIEQSYKEETDKMGVEAAEKRAKADVLLKRSKELDAIIQDKNSTKEQRAEANKEAPKNTEERTKLILEAEALEKKEKQRLDQINEEKKQKKAEANKAQEKILSESRNQYLVDTIYDILTDVDPSERQGWYESKLGDFSADPKRQAEIKALLDERLKADGFMSKDGKFESTKKQSAQTVAAAAETARKNAKYEAKWESNKDGSSAIKDKSGKLGGTVYKQYNTWWYADENGNGFGQQFKSEAEAKAFAENRLQTLLEEKAFADSQPHSKETKNSLVQSEQAVNTDGTVDIVYGFNHHNNKTNKFTKGRAKARIVEGGGRKIVIKNINGVQVPFYCSTGEGGKLTVEAGKWYPFFGVSEKGWINKLSEADINDYYGSPDLKKAAQELDASLGDIREKKGYPQIGTNNEAAKTINKGGKWGVESKQPDTYDKVKANVEALKVELEQAAKNAPQAPKPTAEAPKPTAEAPKPVATGKPVSVEARAPQTAPSLKSRVRSRNKGVELQGPGKPIVINRIDRSAVPKVEKFTVEEEGSWQVRVPVKDRVNTQVVSELYHVMNRVRRRVEHGTEIDTVVRNWLFGDGNTYKGAFNGDRKKIAEFMMEAYKRIVGPRAGSAEAVEWKQTIDEYERTGKITPNTQEAFEKFIEEVGESMFIGWEQGKPFDFIPKGGDLGVLRNFVETLKDTWANHVERTAVNMGADVSTKEAFFEWFKKNKQGGKFKFDPYVEKAFTDLVRVYADKGMKDNGISKANIYQLPPAAIKDQIERYGLEELATQDKDGNWSLKPMEVIHREQQERGQQFAYAFADAVEKDPSYADGMNIFISDEYIPVNSPEAEGKINAGMDALENRSRSGFDPNTMQTLDTQGTKVNGFAFSSGDFDEVGPSLNDLVQAQVSKSRKDGIYKDRGYGTHGARGRPRTTPSGRLGADMKKALAKGKTLIFRGIPNEKAFALFEKHFPKAVSKNLRVIAPIIVDGGHTKSNVLRGTYLGFTQAQDDGTVLDRSRGDTFSAREATFVPYDMEFRITLRNPKNPQIDYKKPHFAAIARIFDVDGLNTRAHHIWRESKELQGMYGHINDYITDIFKTVDEYSASGLIPATDFFGADEWARDKRKFVMAALGANPTREMKATYSVAEADWSEYQHKKGRVGIQGNMHTWKSFRLDNFRNIVSVDNESVPLRVNDKVYRRALVPTPNDGEGRMYEASYSSPDGPIELIMENLRDFHESTGDGEYNHLKVIKGISDPMKLVKRLENAPESSYEQPKSMFNAADTFGGKTPDEIEFLKSNYQWAVQQGDIMLADSMKRFMNQFGKDAILIRHTLEEHLAAGGTIEDYNKDIATGVAVVFPVQHGTGSEAFLRDPEFKPRFLGKTTGADSARMGYFFAGLQETAASYSRMAKLDDSPKQKQIDNLYFQASVMEVLLMKMKDGKFDQVAADKAISEFKKLLLDAGVDEKEATKQADILKQVRKSAIKAIKNLESAQKKMSPAVDAIVKKNLSLDDPKIMRDLALLNGEYAGLTTEEINIKEYAKTFNEKFTQALGKIIHQFEISGSRKLLTDEITAFIGRPYGEEKVVNDFLIRKHDKINEILSAYYITANTAELADNMGHSASQRKLLESQSLLQAAVEIEDAIREVLLSEIKTPVFEDVYRATNLVETQKSVISSSAKHAVRRNFERPILMMRSFVGFKSPYVYDFKGRGRSAGPRFGEIYRTALENGHDGIILKNIHDRGPNDNIVSIAIGKESQIATTDTSLSKTPAPRNSGYKEGGKYLASSGDTLPQGAFGPNNPDTVHISRSFKKAKGFNTGDGSFIIKLNTDKSFRIGMEYERMTHDPFNPKVREAYTLFAKETLEQFEHILEAGYRPEMHISENEPYDSSRHAIKSLKETKILKVLSTDLNFGERKVTDADIKENPLLAMSKHKDINGVPMRVNDVFRFVHDFFGHSERGNSFGPLGEENAWDVHARMYSPTARKAMTAGTRGQNSWVNFIHQPNIEGNRKRDMARRLEREGRIEEANAIKQSIPKTQFAKQKIGLLPDWASKFDSEMTPMEAEIFGKHEVRKSSKGLFSSGDNIEPVWNPEAEEFAIRGAEARASSKFGTSVEIKNPEDYKGYDLFMIGEGRAMASISPDGELGSVLKGINGTSEDVQRVMEAALASGKVRWLNAFDTVLPNMYQKFGFEAVARIKFVDEYRPDGWDYEKYGKFNGGRPDVVFMAYVGPEAMSYNVFRGIEVAGYDDAVAMTHARVEEGKGMFSAGDVYDFDGVTEQTAKDIELIKLIGEYADKSRILDKKIETGELTRQQANMQLTKWHKDNNTGNTLTSWSEFRVNGEKVGISSMTADHVKELIADATSKDKNWKKAQAARLSSESARAQAEAKSVEEQLTKELTEEQKANETAKERFKRIYRNKKNKDGLTMIQRAREWARSLEDEQNEDIIRRLDRDYESKQEALAKHRKETEQMNKMQERLIDQTLLRYAEENEQAQARGEELVHKGDYETLHSKAKSEVEREMMTRKFDESTIVAEIEEKRLTKEQYDKINKEIARQMRGEQVVLNEEGNVTTIYDQEIDEQMYEDLLDAGTDEKKAWNSARKAFLEKTIADVELRTLEDVIAELRKENEDYAKDSDGDVLWTEDQIEAEAFSRLKSTNDIISASKGVIDSVDVSGSKKGSLDYMARVQFANSEWFDANGESILWKGEESGKTFKGIKRREKDDKGNPTGNTLIGEEVVSESVKPVYPPEMEKAVDDLNKRVQELITGSSKNFNREKLLVLLDLYALWGFEINKNLMDDTFVPRRSLMREEGLTGQALSRELAESSGALITGWDVGARFTERLDALPDFYELTKELLSDVIEGAEYTAEQALDLWMSSEKEKGRTPTDAQIRAKKAEIKEKGIASDISFDKSVLDGFIADFMREGNYEFTAEDLMISNPDDYVKEKQKQYRADARKKEKKRLKVKELTPEQEDAVNQRALEELREKAKTEIGFPSRFLGVENSVEARIFTKLWEENQKTREAFNAMTGLQRRKSGKVLRTNEGLRVDAISMAKNIRFKFIQYLFDRVNPLVFEAASKQAEAAGLVELSPAETQAKRRAEAKKAAEKAYEEDTSTPAVVEPVTPVVTEAPKTPSYKDSPAQTEKNRNKDALAAAIAKADAEGKSRPVPTLGALVSAVNATEPKKTPAPSVKQTPQQLGYKVTPDNLKAQHPSGRFAVEKKGGIYEVVEMSTVGDARRVNVRGVFKSFADAHKFIEEKVKGQTPPPAPVGRPSTPKTPEPVKKQIQTQAQNQIKNNTVKPPEQVGQAQALCIAENLAALDPKNHDATATVLNIEDELTLKVDQLSNKTATTVDKRYTATRTKTGIRVVVNAHIDPITKQQVKGSKIGDVQTAEQAQLLIREHAHNQRRALEQQGVDVGGVLQAENPVIAPVQIEKVAATVVEQVQQQPPVTNPKVKAETHPDYTTAVAALQVLGVKVTDAKDRIKIAIDELGMSADKQAIIKHALAQGAPAAQRIANSNQVHVATVNANPTPVTPQTLATVTILPTNSGTVAATGASIPPAPKVNTPPAITTPPVVGPTLPAQTLAQVGNATKFVPRRSRYVLASGVQADGVTYTNAFGYMIVQSGISRWRCFNPAAVLLSVTDNEQEAVDAIMREMFKR